MSTMARIFAVSSAAQLVRGRQQEQMRAIAMRRLSFGLMLKVIFPFFDLDQGSCGAIMRQWLVYDINTVSMGN
ncbi:hypothetical protein LPB67_02845 [Undibacterium sp. Jales W-56]|uniref:hypothetical protein n=1 Tax=Undibacterium sp. Jales W-56 TaxID=2897325 RepID=UPI0021CFA3E2|nr:hypothetical protein [Undibacterium sp. Jales W-56]MCU6432714.1 hypothetical protein [Undibacterium sp. Jales W-56]